MAKTLGKHQERNDRGKTACLEEKRQRRCPAPGWDGIRAAPRSAASPDGADLLPRFPFYPCFPTAVTSFSNITSYGFPAVTSLMEGFVSVLPPVGITPAQCQGCISSLIPHSSCSASRGHQTAPQHPTALGQTSTKHSLFPPCPSHPLLHNPHPSPPNQHKQPLSCRWDLGTPAACTSPGLLLHPYSHLELLTLSCTYPSFIEHPHPEPGGAAGLGHPLGP